MPTVWMTFSIVGLQMSALQDGVVKRKGVFVQI